MNSVSGRFSDICHLYLDGLSMDDVKYLKPDDLIAIVPEHQHNHKLLMTIMVRRYLYELVTETSAKLSVVNLKNQMTHIPTTMKILAALIVIIVRAAMVRLIHMHVTHVRIRVQILTANTHVMIMQR